MRTDYGDNRVSLRLAFRPFVDAFQFRGRSTRTEVLSFWLLGIVGNMMTVTWAEPTSRIALVLPTAWAVLWGWPWLPLLVRRLHDQNRSGWWALVSLAIIPLFAVAWAIASPTESGGFDMSVNWPMLHVSQKVAWTAPMAVLCALILMSMIGTFAFYLLPETIWGNRFGPDPRLTPPAQPILAET